MNTSRIASRVLARFLGKQAMEFPTEEALKDYLHDHPGADESKHSVVKSEGKEDGGQAYKHLTVKPDLAKKLIDALPEGTQFKRMKKMLSEGAPILDANVDHIISALGPSYEAHTPEDRKKEQEENKKRKELQKELKEHFKKDYQHKVM